MKLVSQQMRAEFSPVWLRQWIFQLPRPVDPLSEDLYPNQDDVAGFPQMKGFLDTIGSEDGKYVRHIRLTRHLRAQPEPELAIERETGSELVSMLDEPGDFHEKLVVHIHVRCADVYPSNRRASKDVVVKQRGREWECLCEGSTTTSFDRGWL